MTKDRLTSDIMIEVPHDPRRPNDGKTPPSPSPVVGTPVAPTPIETKPANSLTPEEQMALFEQELKETDWGHQPC